MKSVLFAMNMEGLTPSQIEPFENRVISALKSGSKEYAQVQPYHCDYKESVLRMCSQYDIDVVIINEKLQGKGEIQTIIREIKSDFPTTLIILLLTAERSIGDAFLANMVSSGVYNWVSSPWKPEHVANAIISPKKMKDVEVYMPKIVEGKDGLAFETKIVEKKDIPERLEDLPDLLNLSANNGSASGDVEDLGVAKQNESVGYSRVIGKARFGFSSAMKPKKTKQAKIEIAPEKELPLEDVAEPEKPVFEFKEEKPIFEPKKENPAPVEAKPFVKEESPVEKEEKVEAPKPKPDFSAFVASRKKIEKKEEVAPVKEKIEEPVVVKEVVREVVKEVPVQPVKSQPVAERSKPIDTGSRSLQERFSRAFAEKEKPSVNKEQIPNLKNSGINLKYNKILFVRAMPLGSMLPSTFCNLMGAKFVDFNKKMIENDFFEDVTHTSIREAVMPNADKVVGDVILANGVEKLFPLFDHVILILPEDAFAIKYVVEKHDFIKNCGVVIDNCRNGIISLNNLRKMIPNCLYINKVVTDTCAKDVYLAYEHKRLLNDNNLFFNSLKFLLGELGA